MTAENGSESRESHQRLTAPSARPLPEIRPDLPMPKGVAEPAAGRDDWPHAGRYVIAWDRSQLWSGGSVENRRTFATRAHAENEAFFGFGPGAWIGELRRTRVPGRYNVGWYQASTSEPARADDEDVLASWTRDLSTATDDRLEARLVTARAHAARSGTVHAHAWETFAELAATERALRRRRATAAPARADDETVELVRCPACEGRLAKLANGCVCEICGGDGRVPAHSALRKLVPPTPVVRSEDPPTYGDPREAAGDDATPSGYREQRCRYLQTPDIDWPWAGRWLRTVSRRTGLSADTFLHPRMARAPGTSDRESAVTEARLMFGADAQVAHVLRGSKPHHYRFRVADVPASSEGEKLALGGVVSAAAFREEEERFRANLDEIQRRNAEPPLVAGGQGNTAEDVVDSARAIVVACLAGISGAVVGAVVTWFVTRGGAG